MEKERGLRAGIVEVAMWLALGGCAAAAWYGGSGRIIDAAGVRNLDPFGATMRSGILSLLVIGMWFMLVICGIIVMWRRKRGPWVNLMTVMLMAVAPVLFALGFGGATGHERYRRGFNLWAERNVDVPAIRAWISGRPKVASTMPVARADWPAEVAKIQPDEVDELPMGVGLTWGKSGEFSSRRQVFVTREPDAEPRAIKWFTDWEERDPGWWTRRGTGAWTSLQ
jgi:hypothetical protein